MQIRSAEYIGAGSALVAGSLALTCGLRAALVGGALTWLLAQLQQNGQATLKVRCVSHDELEAALNRRLASVGTIHLVKAAGPLLFWSAARIDALLPRRPPWPAYMVLDLRLVTQMDSTALEALQQVLECLITRGGQVALIAQKDAPFRAALAGAELPSLALGQTCCTSREEAFGRVALHAGALRSPAGRTHADNTQTVVRERSRGTLRLVRLPHDGV